MKINKKLSFFLKLLVSCLLIIYLVYSVNWQEVVFYFKQIKVFYLCLYLFFYLLGIVISSRKWQVLAQSKGFTNKLKFYIETYMIGTFINNFLPSFVGGDSYRAFRLGDENKRYKTSSCTVIVDRVSGLLAVMTMSVFFSFFNFGIYSENSVMFLIILVLMGGLTVLIILLFLVKWKKNFFKDKLLRFLPKKVSEYLFDFASFRKNETVFKFMSYSFIFNFIGVAVANFALFQAMNVHLNFLNFLSVIFLISILSSFSIGLGNLGVKETVYSVAFGFLGVPSSASVSVSMIGRFLQMLVSFSVLPLFLKQKKKVKKLN